jgi:hypothetical protein
MVHREMVLVLRSIHLVLIFVHLQQHLKHDQFLELHIMLEKIVHQYKHLEMVEWLECVQYKHEQLHKKLTKKNSLFKI